MESVDHSMIRKPAAFGTAMNVCQGGELLILFGTPAGEDTLLSHRYGLCPTFCTSGGQCLNHACKPLAIACSLLSLRCAGIGAMAFCYGGQTVQNEVSYSLRSPPSVSAPAAVQAACGMGVWYTAACKRFVVHTIHVSR